MFQILLVVSLCLHATHTIATSLVALYVCDWFPLPLLVHCVTVGKTKRIPTFISLISYTCTSSIRLSDHLIRTLMILTPILRLQYWIVNIESRRVPVRQTDERIDRQTDRWRCLATSQWLQFPLCCWFCSPASLTVRSRITPIIITRTVA